jgi:hypothetical protein
VATDQETGSPRSHGALDGSANEAVFALTSVPVRILTLALGAERIPRSGEEYKTDELWHGHAYSTENPDANDIPVFVRLANPMPVAAELLCSVIGRALGLPVPEPFAIHLASGALPGSKMLPAAGTVAFASHDIGGTAFNQLLNKDSPTAHAMLAKWSHLVPIATFDEWLANPDRNLGNIIFASNVLWIIDHAEAFGGSEAEMFGLATCTTTTFANQLGIQLAELSSEVRIEKLEACRTWIEMTASKLDIGNAIACADIARWQNEERRSELLSFITTRLTLTHSFLCNRLGHPQLKLSSAAA